MGRSHPWWATVGYLAVLLLVFGGALWPGANTLIFGDDIHRAYYFYRQFFNSFLKEGIWPWWNPYNFAGSPFMAHPIVNIWYPPTWLFVLLPLNVAYSWHLALHLLWAMLGMYTLLCRVISNNPIIQLSNEKQLSTFHLPAWVGGLVFGLSGFFAARIWAGHVDVIAAASWMPWVVAAFSQLMHAQVGAPWFSRRQGPDRFFPHHDSFAKAVTTLETSRLPARECVIAGSVLAMQLLAGYQTMALFTLEAVAVFLGISLIARRVSLAMVIATIARVSLSIVLAIGLFAAVLIPQQEFFRQTIRTYAFPYSWNAYGSLEWKSLGQLLTPFLFGDQVGYHGPPPNFAEHAFFVGRMSLLMVIVGLTVGIGSYVYRRRNYELRIMNDGKNEGVRPWVWFLSFFVVALLGLWVSLGPNAPIDLQYILWKLVPMYKYLRLPPRHLILVVFGLSGMVGMVISYLNAKWEDRGVNLDNDVRRGKNHHVSFLTSHFDIKLPTSHFPLLTLVVGAITVEMVLYARHFIALKPIPETRHDAELIKILKQDKEPYRVLPNFGAWILPRDSFDFDAAMSYRIFSSSGYDTMILRHYYEFIDAANGRDKPSILDHDVQVPYLNVFSQATDFLNIKYILVPRAYDPLYGVKSDRFVLLREDSSRDYRLYENKTVKPRFFFEGGGRATIEKYGPNEIVLTVDTPKDETLMSSEVFYPGWEGFVDGQKVDIIKTNHAFRALFVPAGRHTVTYRYTPRIFWIGGIVSFGSLGIVCYVFLRSMSSTHNRKNS